MMQKRILPCGCKISWDENSFEVKMCVGHSCDYGKFDKNNFEDIEEQQFLKTLITPSKELLQHDLVLLSTQLI
jgi:hypothetical protein